MKGERTSPDPHERIAADAVARSTPPHVAAARAIQAGAGNRVLARRLKATAGSDGDWKRFLALAEPAAGFRFVRNKAGVVSAAPQKPRKSPAQPSGPTQLAPGQAPPLSAPRFSQVFHDRMRAIIDDRTQDAEIHIGSGQTGVLFGGFPKGGVPDKVQRIDIDDVEAVERWTPGHGVAKLLHEIVENHIGHGTGFVYDDSHAGGTSVEADVLKEISGASTARGGTASMPDPSNSSETIFAFDYVDHFLVVNVAADGSIVRSRRTAAKVVKRVTLGDFEPGKAFVDPTTPDNIAAFGAFINAWIGTDLATVRIEGPVDAAGSPDLGLQRAAATLKGLNYLLKKAPFKSSDVALTASATPGRRAEIAVVVPNI